MIISKRPRLTVLLISALLLIALYLLVSVWSHRLFYYKKLEKSCIARNPSFLFWATPCSIPLWTRLRWSKRRDPRLMPLNAALGGAHAARASPPMRDCTSRLNPASAP